MAHPCSRGNRGLGSRRPLRNSGSGSRPAPAGRPAPGRMRVENPAAPRVRPPGFQAEGRAPGTTASAARCHRHRRPPAADRLSLRQALRLPRPRLRRSCAAKLRAGASQLIDSDDLATLRLRRLWRHRLRRQRARYRGPGSSVVDVAPAGGGAVPSPCVPGPAPGCVPAAAAAGALAGSGGVSTIWASYREPAAGPAAAGRLGSRGRYRRRPRPRNHGRWWQRRRLRSRGRHRCRHRRRHHRRRRRRRALRRRHLELLLRWDYLRLVAPSSAGVTAEDRRGGATSADTRLRARLRRRCSNGTPVGRWLGVSGLGRARRLRRVGPVVSTATTARAASLRRVVTAPAVDSPLPLRAARAGRCSDRSAAARFAF